ncbi:helix-turn-helix domain-containing protein [Streptomyces virginiae]
MDGSEEEPVPAAVIAEAVLPGDIRKRLQLMQTDVAERMGVSQQTVARIEKEHHVPERLAAYLRAMGYRLEMFAVRDGERIRLR